MATIAKETDDLRATVYRLHERWPGFQLADGTTYAVVSGACAEIAKAARIMLRNAERRCNGMPRYDAKARMVLNNWTDADEAAAKRSDDKAEARIRLALVSLYGPDWQDRIDMQTQGDPRGAMVKLWAKGERDIGSPRLVA